MPGLSDDIDFSSLSDEELLKLLDEEKEKRKHFAPARAKSNSKAAGTKPKTGRKPATDVVEIDLD